MFSVRVRKKESGPLFDMRRTGANIARLRKSKGVTRARLAEALGISADTVSNWEEGLSSPDASALGALAALLGTSTEYILGSRRAAEIISDAEAGCTPALDIRELIEIAPLLRTEQADRLAGSVSGAVTPDGVLGLAPFLGDAALKRLAERVPQGAFTSEDTAALAGFLDEDAVGLTRKLSGGERI